MRLSRTDRVAVLTIMAGGLVGFSLSSSFLLLSRSADVPAPAPVVAPAPSVVLAPSVRVLRFEVPPRLPTGIEAIAAHLVREQHYIESAMEHLEKAQPNRQTQRHLLFERKEAMHEEIVELELEIQRLAGEARGELREASEWLDRARRTIEDNKLKERVRYSRGLIGTRNREYRREFEAETSRIVEELHDELQSASRGLTPIRGLLFGTR